MWINSNCCEKGFVKSWMATFNCDSFQRSRLYSPPPTPPPPLGKYPRAKSVITLELGTELRVLMRGPQDEDAYLDQEGSHSRPH